MSMSRCSSTVFTVYGRVGLVLEGKTFISPQAEFTPKNVQTKEERVKLSFAVKIEVENPGGELKPGMPADAVLGNAAH